MVHTISPEGIQFLPNTDVIRWGEVIESDRGTFERYEPDTLEYRGNVQSPLLKIFGLAIQVAEATGNKKDFTNGEGVNALVVGEESVAALEMGPFYNEGKDGRRRFELEIIDKQGERHGASGNLTYEHLKGREYKLVEDGFLQVDKGILSAQWFGQFPEDERYIRYYAYKKDALEGAIVFGEMFASIPPMVDGNIVDPMDILCPTDKALLDHIAKKHNVNSDQVFVNVPDGKVAVLGGDKATYFGNQIYTRAEVIDLNEQRESFITEKREELWQSPVLMLHQVAKELGWR